MQQYCFQSTCCKIVNFLSHRSVQYSLCSYCRTLVMRTERIDKIHQQYEVYNASPIRDTVGCMKYDQSRGKKKRNKRKEKEMETSRLYKIVQIDVIFIQERKKVEFGGSGARGLRSSYISAVGIQVFQDVHRRFILLKIPKLLVHVCAG